MGGLRGFTLVELSRRLGSLEMELEFLVKRPGNLHLSDNGDGASDLLVDHKSKNSHHSGTALVELNGTLLELPLLALLVPAEVVSITEVAP